MNDILSRDELQYLIERNNANPDLARPVYERWTDNKGVCATVSQLMEANRKAGLDSCKPFDAAGQQRWLKRLNSKKFRVQPAGKKDAYVVERPIRTQNGWRMVPLNA